MTFTTTFLVESITQEELVSLLNQNPSFKGYFQGYVAENKLEKQLRLIPEFSNIYKIPDVHKRKGDFCVTYKGKELTIELKSLATRGIKNDLLSGGIRGSVSLKHTGSREMKNGNKTVSLSRSKFDVLAICTLASSTKWEFKYILNKYIPSATIGPEFLTTKFQIDTENTPFLRDNILDILADIA